MDKRQEKLEVIALMNEEATYFDEDMRSLLEVVPLKPVEATPVRIACLWDDVKEAVGFATVIKERGVPKWQQKWEVWGNPSAIEASELLVRKFYNKASEVYPKTLTSHMLKWYSIFPNFYLTFNLEPAKRYYEYFFTLMGETRIEELEDLVGEEINLHTLIHRLHTKQAAKARPPLLRELLSDPEIVEQLRKGTYVLPAHLEFTLRTSQVYAAYAKALLEGKSLPLLPPNQERQERKLVREHKELLERIVSLKAQGHTLLFK